MEFCHHVMPLENWSTCKGISTSCISQFTWRLTKCLDVVMFSMLYLLFIVKCDFSLVSLLYYMIKQIVTRCVVSCYGCSQKDEPAMAKWPCITESQLYIAHLNQNKENFWRTLLCSYVKWQNNKYTFGNIYIDFFPVPTHWWYMMFLTSLSSVISKW